MPLQTPVKRQHIHTRQIHFSGYEREDGLFDIEAHLTDTKTYAFSNNWRGEIQPGTALHEMLLRVTINDKLEIQDIEAVTENSPFQMCPDITPVYKELVGVAMGPGWRQVIRQRVGGVQGCTHLTELLYPMATVAIQTIRPLQNHRRRVADSDSRASQGRPFVLNTCHAWAEHSPVVQHNAPDYYVPRDVPGDQSQKIRLSPATEESTE
jgi:hypothetical protein